MTPFFSGLLTEGLHEEFKSLSRMGNCATDGSRMAINDFSMKVKVGADVGGWIYGTRGWPLDS